MYVIQLIEEFYKHEQAIQALQMASEMPGFLGGKTLIPLLDEYKYRIRVFFETNEEVAHAPFPEGIELVYVPERLLTWYGIEVE